MKTLVRVAFTCGIVGLGAVMLGGVLPMGLEDSTFHPAVLGLIATTFTVMLLCALILVWKAPE